MLLLLWLLPLDHCQAPPPPIFSFPSKASPVISKWWVCRGPKVLLINHSENRCLRFIASNNSALSSMGRAMNNSRNPGFLEDSVTQTERFFMQGLRNQEPSKIFTGTRDFLFCHLLDACLKAYFVLCWWIYPRLAITCLHRSGRGHVTYWEERRGVLI